MTAVQLQVTVNVSDHMFWLFDPSYLMNFLLDATLGMLVIWLAVKLVSKLVEYKQWTLLMFGEYGESRRLAEAQFCLWPLDGAVGPDTGRHPLK